MELADVTDSKSVGSNTVRVRPPPSAPKNNTPLNKRGIIFWCGGRENPQLAGKAWMQDGGRTKSAQGRADPNDRNSTPRYTFARSTSGVLFLVLGEGEHATCG